jgi:predicted transposase/invertase (TIGR01784 family)
MKERSLISFDWAMKRLLRQKANFEVLEGFLSELLYRKIVIKSISESEGNKTDKENKSNKVDILVEADDRELVIIELQYDSVAEYYHRMLFGVSKAITDYMYAGSPYSNVRKVYSVNIVYFDLEGDDYIYHGITNFTGLHTHTELRLTADQQRLYNKNVIGEICPEYYLIAVSGFDNVARNTLDEWVYYLKNSEVKDGFTAKGLDMVKKLLRFDNLSEEEKSQYLKMLDDKLLSDSAINTAMLKGEIKGEAIGLEKGEAIGLEKGEAIGLEKGEAIGLEKGFETVIINSYLLGHTIESIASITGYTTEQVIAVLKQNGLIQ